MISCFSSHTNRFMKSRFLKSRCAANLCSHCSHSLRGYMLEQEPPCHGCAQDCRHSGKATYAKSRQQNHGAHLRDKAEPLARGVRVLRPPAEAAAAAVASVVSLGPRAHQALVILHLLLVLRSRKGKG